MFWSALISVSFPLSPAKLAGKGLSNGPLRSVWDSMGWKSDQNHSALISNPDTDNFVQVTQWFESLIRTAQNWSAILTLISADQKKNTQNWSALIRTCGGGGEVLQKLYNGKEEALNFCSVKKQTLQNFVVKKADSTNFCSAKKWTLQNLRGTLQNHTHNVDYKSGCERDGAWSHLDDTCTSEWWSKVTCITNCDTASIFINVIVIIILYSIG